MSKVFIVRFHVIQFTRYSVAAALAVSFYILAHQHQIVKNFFQVFSILFAVLYVFCCPRGQLWYIIRYIFFCQALFTSFFIFLSGSSSHFLQPGLPRLFPLPSLSIAAAACGRADIRMLWGDQFPPMCCRSGSTVSDGLSAFLLLHPSNPLSADNPLYPRRRFLMLSPSYPQRLLLWLRPFRRLPHPLWSSGHLLPCWNWSLP